jgi:WD40 repeat protein
MGSKTEGYWELTFVFWDTMTGEQVNHDGPRIPEPTGEFAISPDLTAGAFPHHNNLHLMKIPEMGQESSIHVFYGHKDPIGGCTFSPDSRVVAATSVQSISTWLVKDGKCKQMIETKSFRSDQLPPAPIISSDGNTIAARFWKRSFTEKYIGLWSTRSGLLEKEFAMPYMASDHASAFSPDGESFVLLSGENKHLELTTWDTVAVSLDGKPDQRKSQVPVAIALSEAKQAVAIAFRNGEIEIWDLLTDSGNAARSLNCQESAESGFVPVDRLVFSDNGKRIAYGMAMTTSSPGDDEETVRVRDTESGQALASSAWTGSDMDGICIELDAVSLLTVRPKPIPSDLPVVIRDSWLYWRSEPVLLLPSQCRVQEGYGSTIVVEEGNKIALAFTTGRFSVFDFRSSEMEHFLGKNTHLLPTE